MKRVHEINASTLWPLAQLAALTTYREAFKHGMLGQSHRAVVGEVYGLVADELAARKRWAARVGFAWAGLWIVLWGTGVLAALLGLTAPWWHLVEDARIVCLVLAARWFGSWMALDKMARLLTPPVVVEAAHELEGDPSI